MLLDHLLTNAEEWFSAQEQTRKANARNTPSEWPSHPLTEAWHLACLQVHLYPGKPESNSGVLHHPLHSTSCNTFKNPYITSPSDDLSTPSTSDPTSAPKTNSKSHLSSETTSSLSSDGAISRDANVVLTAKHQDLDNAFDWSGLMELHSEGSGSAHLNLSREGTFTSKKWQCSICPYTVDRAKKLEIHMRKHTGEKPYACPHCSYMASQRSNLNRHMLKHSETQLLRCPFCPYLTEVQHVLDSHVMNHQDQWSAIVEANCLYSGHVYYGVRIVSTYYVIVFFMSSISERHSHFET